MTTPSTLTNSWKRYYEHHPDNNLSNAKLVDIEGILGHDQAIDTGDAEYCSSGNFLV
jgi:hypothetical protein